VHVPIPPQGAWIFAKEACALLGTLAERLLAFTVAASPATSPPQLVSSPSPPDASPSPVPAAALPILLPLDSPSQRSDIRARMRTVPRDTSASAAAAAAAMGHLVEADDVRTVTEVAGEAMLRTLLVTRHNGTIEKVRAHVVAGVRQ